MRLGPSDMEHLLILSSWKDVFLIVEAVMDI